MESAMIWLKSFFAFVTLPLKVLFGSTETEMESEHANAAVATAEAAVTASEAAAVAADSAVAAARTKEQRKQAIASVAAAEAANDTAVAAIAAAQAAVAAVRVPSHVRGYLAMKVSRALKGLVKLLAMVRGYLVTKYATTSVYAMQAPIRAQAIVCSPKNCRLISNNTNDDVRRDQKFPRDISRLSASLETSFDAIDESSKKLKVDPKYTAYTQSVKAKLRSYQASKQRVELKGGLKKRLSNASNTPIKSICADKFIRGNGNLPTYMANTRSFKAKCTRIP